MKQKLCIFALMLALLMTIAACMREDNGPDLPGESQGSDSSETPFASDTTAGEVTATAEHTAEQITTVAPYVPIDSENPIVQTAEALIGIPFADNGTTPADGFDNSGFIYYVLRENGFINCPRHTAEQAAMGTHIDYDKLKAGDLAFFSSEDSGNADFGGIYIGDGRMIYSPMPGQTVKVADITSDYWRNTFIVGVSLS